MSYGKLFKKLALSPFIMHDNPIAYIPVYQQKRK